MKQLPLLVFEEQRTALIELEAGLREELVALMAAAIEAIVLAGMEVDDELVDECEDPR
jgi:hypothetical protein